MLTACLLIFSTLVPPLFGVRPPTLKKTELAPLVIRVGVMYYDDDKTQYSRIEQILSALSRRDRPISEAIGRPEIVFKQAVGTYDEVLDWYRTDQIDLAIMNPGPVALLLEKMGDSSLDEAFVGIRKREPSKTSLAYSISGGRSRDKYHAATKVCAGFCDCWWTAIRRFVDCIFIRSESLGPHKSRVRGQVSVSESNSIHLAEYGRQSLRWMAVPMLVCGFVLCMASIGRSRSLLSRYGARIEKERGWAFGSVISIALILVVAVVYTSLFVQKSLFVSEGIQQKMAFEIPALLNLRRPADSSAKTLGELSREIVQGHSIRRDLVITGSMLPDASEVPKPKADVWDDRRENDSDLYFYYRADPTRKLPDNVLKDGKFVDLRAEENETILLDAVIGSRAIYPAFEPRTIASLRRVTDPASKPNVSIIDGGFIHNSPSRRPFNWVRRTSSSSRRPRKISH